MQEARDLRPATGHQRRAFNNNERAAQKYPLFTPTRSLRTPPHHHRPTAFYFFAVAHFAVIAISTRGIIRAPMCAQSTWIASPSVSTTRRILPPDWLGRRDRLLRAELHALSSHHWLKRCFGTVRLAEAIFISDSVNVDSFIYSDAGGAVAGGGRGVYGQSVKAGGIRPYL